MQKNQETSDQFGKKEKEKKKRKKKKRKEKRSTSQHKLTSIEFLDM